MARRTAKTTSDERQFDLSGNWYPVPAPPRLVPGSLACGARLCGVLAQAIGDCGLSRAEVAFRMSELTGDAISEAMLNAWTAKSHDRHRFPVEYAAAFEAATDSIAIQQLLAEQRGTRVMVAEEVLDAELGRVRRQMDQLRRRERQLRTLTKGGAR